MSNIKGNDAKRRVLNQLVLYPALKPAAKHAGIHPTTLFAWIKESMADPTKHRFQWLGRTAPFFQHVNAARKLNVVALDHAARDLAINGHREPKFHDGKPVWKVDAKIAADALTMDDDTWAICYGDRERSDAFARDKAGQLIQEVTTSPPNPAILVKLLTSLAPEIYSDKSEVNVTHQGSVWIEGMSTSSKPIEEGHGFNEAFALTHRPEDVKRPINTLAMPRPCANSDEFDARFRKKLLREVVLFRDAEGKLLPPLPDDVIVAGTPQARAFEDAGIEIKPVRAETVLDEGFENPWLKELAPHHKRKPPKVEPVAAKADIPQQSDRVVEPVERPGFASPRWDSERIGRTRPPPGGRRVRL